jgi:hypothetical protein
MVTALLRELTVVDLDDLKQYRVADPENLLLPAAARVATDG